MSISTTPPESQPRGEPSYECARDDCDDEFDQGDAVAGSYCSKACYLRTRGRRRLRVLESDHRYCATCFRRLKHTDSVPEWRRRSLGPETESALTAIQTRTEHGQLGETTKRTPEGVPDDTKIGTICECGNASTNHRVDILQQLDVRGTVANLLAALDAVHREGQTSTRVPPLALVRALQAQTRGGHSLDFELAVGFVLEETS